MRLSFAVFALALGFSAPALACDGEKETHASKPYSEVDLATFAAHVEKKTAVIVDVNKPERFAKGHVPGAVHATVSDDGKLGGATLPADKKTTLAFYCSSERCGASAEAAEAAAAVGYASIVVYKGGIAGWEKAGKPVSKLEGKASAPVAKPTNGDG
jgi:rhodanese-related sulfurtransferase